MKLFLIVITITLALISNTFGSKRSQNCNCQDEIEDLRKENTDRQIEIGLLREQDIEINTELTNMKETQVQCNPLLTRFFPSPKNHVIFPFRQMILLTLIINMMISKLNSRLTYQSFNQIMNEKFLLLELNLQK